jgi:hypothetical protein
VIALNCCPALADMTTRVARSAGSFFAAAMSCERRDKISSGQTAALLAELDRYLSPADKRRMQRGFDKGARRSAVFVPNKGWVRISFDDADCFRVQGVLDDYKMHLTE